MRAKSLTLIYKWKGELCMSNSSNLNYYYKLKEECVTKQNKYKNSLSICNNLVNELNSFKNSLGNVKDALAVSFTINGKTADDGVTEQLIEKISNMSSIISGQIIPQIQTEITQLTNKINEYDRQIAYLIKQAQEESKKENGV